MTAAVEAMFSVKEVPWHGLGVILDKPPKVEDAIKMAGLDWDVMLQPAYSVVAGEQVELPARATIRSTNNSVLGVVGPSYTVVQNSTAFDFFQPFVDKGIADLVTAGSLKDGKRVWVLAKIKADPAEIVPGDTVERYILLSNSHDGTLAVRCGFTTVRVVCCNTLAAAHDAASSKLLRVRHTKNAEFALDKIQEIMNVAQGEFEATTEQFKALARANVVTTDLQEYVRRVFKPKVILPGTEGEALDKADRLCSKIIPLFESGRGAEIKGVKGTMWGAYNAISEYATWDRGRSTDTRMDSLWFGDSANILKRALAEGLKMAAA